MFKNNLKCSGKLRTGFYQSFLKQTLLKLPSITYKETFKSDKYY